MVQFLMAIFMAAFSSVSGAPTKEQAIKSLTMIQAYQPEEDRTRLGTGFAIRKNLVITASHVVGAAKTVILRHRKADGKYNDVKGLVLINEPGLDIAVVLTAADFNFLNLAYNNPEHDQHITKLSYDPQEGSLDIKEGSYDKMELSFNVEGEDTPRYCLDKYYLQCDFGNSGGAIVNDRMEVVGLLVVRSSHSVTYAVPYKVLREVLIDMGAYNG